MFSITFAEKNKLKTVQRKKVRYDMNCNPTARSGCKVPLFGFFCSLFPTCLANMQMNEMG